jgi:hypothetical protein
MEFIVRRVNDDQMAVVEVKWVEQSTKGWIVIFVSVPASPGEITGGPLSEYDPVRLRVIAKAHEFFRKFPETRSTVERGEKINGSAYRQRSHFELASAETEL